MPLVRAIATEVQDDTALLVSAAAGGRARQVSLVALPVLRDAQLTEWDRGLVRKQLREQERLWWVEPAASPGELARAEPFIGDRPLTVALSQQGLAITVADHPLPWARHGTTAVQPTFVERAQHFTEMFTGGVFLLIALLIIAVRRRTHGASTLLPQERPRGVRGAIGWFLGSFIPIERTVGRSMLPPKDRP